MDELVGIIVLVHPQLTTDPANRRGQVGIITGADLANDTIAVGFGTNTLGYYMTNALMVLKPHNQLYQDLLTNVKELDIQDFKTLLRVNMLQESGRPKQLREALEMVMSSKTTLDFATISLQHSLGLDYAQTQQQDKVSGISR